MTGRTYISLLDADPQAQGGEQTNCAVLVMRDIVASSGGDGEGGAGGGSGGDCSCGGMSGGRNRGRGLVAGTNSDWTKKAQGKKGCM